MMSDGALSQDEIDALLAGVDSSSAGSPMGGGMSSSHGGSAHGGGAPAATAVAGGSNADRIALEKFFSSTTNALSSNLSALTGIAVSLVGPHVDFTGRDNFLASLPNMVTAISANYTSGFPGEHIFIFPKNRPGQSRA